MLNREGLGESGEVYLVSYDNLMLTPSRFSEGLEFNQIVGSEPVELCKSNGGRMTGAYPDYRGIEIFGTSLCNDTYGFTTLAEIDVAELEAPTTALSNIIIIAVAATQSIVGVMAFIIAKRISKPIADAAKIAKTISEGDLNVVINRSKSKDEVGILTNSIADMTVNLKSVLFKVRDATHSVSTGANQLSTAGTQLDTAAQQIATTVDEMARGSAGQAADLEDSKQIVESLNSEFEDLTHIVSSSAKASKVIDELSENSKIAAKQAGDKMDLMVEVSEVTSNTVKKLVSQTQEITNVVDAIKEMSEQINLLALNAAIEAARAGESGRGFAVVADEVRRLAENSAKSTKDIANRLTQIRTDGNVAVEAIETNAKTIEDGKKVISSSVTALDEIATKIKDITAYIEQLSEKTGNQSIQMKSVLEKAVSVAAVSEQSAAATEEVSASVEEQTAQISEINSSAGQLTSLAEELQSSLSKFRFDSTDKTEQFQVEEIEDSLKKQDPPLLEATVSKSKKQNNKNQ